MIKKDIIVIVLIAFMLTLGFFGIQTTRSATPYDAWLDYNEDGTINMRDIGATVQAFGASGDPTKNVSVNQYNFTGGYLEIIVAPDETGRINITTAGYKKITLGFRASPFMPPFEGNVSIATGFLLWNSTLCVDVDRFNAPPGWTGPDLPYLYDYPVSRTYEIRGSALVVAYYNPNLDSRRLVIEYFITA